MILEIINKKTLESVLVFSTRTIDGIYYDQNGCRIEYSTLKKLLKNKNNVLVNKGTEKEA